MRHFLNGSDQDGVLFVGVTILLSTTLSLAELTPPVQLFQHQIVSPWLAKD
jgi:hypothetical protein